MAGAKGKPSAAVRKMQEKMAKRQAAEAEAARLEAERLAAIEAEEARLQEEERLKEEKIAERKRKKKEKLERQKAEGTYLTGKAKEEARRREAMRNQMLAAAGMDVSDLQSDAKPKRVVYEKRKKRQPKKPDAAEAEAEAAPAGVPEAEKPAAVEVGGGPGHPGGRRGEPPPQGLTAAAMPVPQAAEEPPASDDEEEDWDAKDWDKELAAPAPDELAPGEAGESAGEEGSDSDSEASESTYYSDSDEEREARIEAARERRLERFAAAKAARSPDHLRSPICCILGHVDTGKTKILDKIRGTNVQDREAGGITQQIGATFIPSEEIDRRTAAVREVEGSGGIHVPALLVIDTPGHESFTNLRSRGSGLCDIAILVVDIMHGLEQQTIESLNMLRNRKTPFVVALNKIDRIYGWQPTPDGHFRETLAAQDGHAQKEFEDRYQKAVLALNEQGLNVAKYWDNPDPRSYVNVIPTSAITGEGIPDMLYLLVHMTQTRMKERLMHIAYLQCTVLEVKKIEGVGTTIDVILINGTLREGDRIVVSGYDGPIVTTVRALLTPHPMREMRVKGSYLHHKEIRASQGVKIVANDLENALAGTQVMVLGPEDDLDDLKEEVQSEVEGVLASVDKTENGVCVQASTLGSLEALLEFLRSDDVQIPVSGISIGPIHKHDVLRASIALEKDAKEFAVILAFDVEVTKEARDFAADAGVKIFTADIIYHLFDQFTSYMEQVKVEKKKAVEFDATFPCVMSIMPQYVFNKKDPIVLGVQVLAGICKTGTPICVPNQDFLEIGRIASIEHNHKVVETVSAREHRGRAGEGRGGAGRRTDWKQ